MSIITYGLDPMNSKLITFGYGSEIIIEITIIPPSGGRRKKKEDRIIRIRIIDEDGRTFIQEKEVIEKDLKKLKFLVSENKEIKGKEILIRINELNVKENLPTHLKIKIYEITKR